eukprot:COSAG02_NODE_872_length_16321_cov_6.491062_3_plen_179_part_00
MHRRVPACPRRTSCTLLCTYPSTPLSALVHLLNRVEYTGYDLLLAARGSTTVLLDVEVGVAHRERTADPRQVRCHDWPDGWNDLQRWCVQNIEPQYGERVHSPLDAILACFEPAVVCSLFVVVIIGPRLVRVLKLQVLVIPYLAEYRHSHDVAEAVRDNGGRSKVLNEESAARGLNRR